MRTVHAVLPDGIDDPARPSGGNVYDRRVCGALRSLGWSVHEHPVPGFWGPPDAAAFAALEDVVRRIPDRAVVLLDGLVASTAPEVLVRQAARLRLVVLVHMPLGQRTQERAALTAAAAVITTSAWTRRRLHELYALPTETMHVAQPGVDAVHDAALATGTADGTRLLCVAAVTHDKGHDVLLEALTTIADLAWECTCVGRLDRDAAFVEAMRRRGQVTGLKDRVHFPGPRTGPALGSTYAAADLMVLASRAETYGMVVAEALAHGVPVLAADVGGVAEALGHGAGQTRPGVLVAPDDPAALAAALRAWLSDAGLRARLRQAARERRGSLPTWPATAAVIADVLSGAAR
ncbi:MAG TPA: glycosyltransferase family 4 protein [Solirubrobacteraceae bacterium]|nr:glycosyltransferase family 4 protein [Solirubrobacteraceae bacterium]